MTKLLSTLLPYRSGCQTEALIHNCLHIRSSVLEGEQVARKLIPGQTYGHSIEFLKNMALWPLELRVETDIAHSHQLEYLNTQTPKEWICVVTLHPNHRDKKVALLYCIQRETGEDEIRTRVISNAGFEDSVTVGVEID